MQENKASRLFLVCSLILGILAAVVSFAYLSNSKAADNVPKAKILVAAHDIRENSVLDPDRDFIELPVPETMRALTDRSLSPAYKDAYKGQRVNRMILSGTPIMLADLIMPAADLAPAGDKRAMSIKAYGASALSGLLVPGDYVKLLVTYTSVPNAATTRLEVGKDLSSVYHTSEVLPDPVKVLAVGSHLSRSRQQITVSDQFQRPQEVDTQQTVTLEVTEDQAMQIQSLTGAGEHPVWVILCPHDADKK